MKKDIHPDYREVVFTDASVDFRFITRSTATAKDTIEIDGKTYPHIPVDISSQSHPFFTGKMKFVDTAGRVEKFQNKFSKTMKKQKKEKEAAVEQAKLDAIEAAAQREEEKVARAEAKAKADEKRAKDKAAVERKKQKEIDKIAAAKAALDAKNNVTPEAVETETSAETSADAPEVNAEQAPEATTEDASTEATPEAVESPEA